MSTAERRRRRRAEPPVEVLIPSLPNDIALNILARLPRRCLAVLSAVSKSLRSAISSPHLYNARSLLNRTESQLYLRVVSPCLTLDHWFSVHRNLNPNSTENNLLQLHLAPVPPILVEARLKGSAYTILGTKIYVIGGYTRSEDGELIKPSSDVWVLDCRTHTWERGPSMLVPRFSADAAVVDGKVYVFGGRLTEELWVEVLDPVAGRWEGVPGPFDGIIESIFGSKMVNGKVRFWLNGEEIWLDPMTKKCVELRTLNSMLMTDQRVEVDGALYKCGSGWKFERFDERLGVWKELKGVEEGKPRHSCQPTLLNLGGRLVVLFAQMRSGNRCYLKIAKVGVWCAEIDVKENGDGDWSAQVHWSEKVPVLPERDRGSIEDYFVDSLSFYFFRQLSVTQVS